MDPTSDEFQELFTKDAWRVFRIISEFVEGFETLTDLGPSVSIFGSARLPSSHPYYQLATKTAYHIAKRGFAIITGGGPGIMEAANKGAKEAKSGSCGLSIDLPFEQEPNPYIDLDYNLKFRYFFVRKVMFIRYAQGFVFLPGGFGTKDELFEALTLIQTKKTKSFPIILMGKDYWKGLYDWLKNQVLTTGCISKKDLQMLHLTDNPEEVAEIIERHYQRNRDIKNF